MPLPEPPAGAVPDKPTRLHVGWIIPPFFHELPIDTDDPQEAAERVSTLATQLLPHHSVDEQYAFALMNAAQLEALRENHAVYAGFCFMDVEGRASTASVAVYQLPVRGTEGDDAAGVEILAALRRAYPDDDVRDIELPCGPAVSRIGAAPFILPAQISPTKADLLVERGLIHVYIPLPDTEEMLLFELSTPSMEDWDLYSELFAEILRTVDWGTDQEIAQYASVSQQPAAPEPPDPEVTRGLYWHSSRVLDVLALHGRMDAVNELSRVTCQACWARGLRSPCSAQHHWRIDEADPVAVPSALQRLAAHLAGNGWTVEPWETEGGAPARNAVHASAPADATPGTAPHTAPHTAPGSAGYGIRAVSRADQCQLDVEITSPCARTILAPADSAFG